MDVRMPDLIPVENFCHQPARAFWPERRLVRFS